MQGLLKAPTQAAKENQVNLNTIPPITHELGRHWRQPSSERILLDDTHALMDSKTLAELPEYSTTFPTGVYEGKMWKRDESVFRKDGRLLLCWFGPSDEPEKCALNYRVIIAV